MDYITAIATKGDTMRLRFLLLFKSLAIADVVLACSQMIVYNLYVGMALRITVSLTVISFIVSAIGGRKKKGDGYTD